MLLPLGYTVRIFMYSFFHALDLSTFQALHDISGKAAWSDSVILFFGHWLPYVVLAAVLVLALRDFWAGQKINAASYAVALISGLVARYGVAEAIRVFYHRPRPFIALDLPHLLTEMSYSFPSGHSIFFFALAAGVFAQNRRVGSWLFVAALLIGLGRIAAGVHYPSDIVGGALLGILVGFLGARLLRAYGKRG